VCRGLSRLQFQQSAAVNPIQRRSCGSIHCNEDTCLSKWPGRRYQQSSEGCQAALQQRGTSSHVRCHSSPPTPPAMGAKANHLNPPLVKLVELALLACLLATPLQASHAAEEKNGSNDTQQSTTTITCNASSQNASAAVDVYLCDVATVSVSAATNGSQAADTVWKNATVVVVHPSGSLAAIPNLPERSVVNSTTSPGQIGKGAIEGRGTGVLPKPSKIPAAPASPAPDAGCFCFDLYDPVCGSNDKTYGNSCEASCDGISTYRQGEC
jgi:hypothetical protein